MLLPQLCSSANIIPNVDITGITLQWHCSEAVRKRHRQRLRFRLRLRKAPQSLRCSESEGLCWGAYHEARR